ncbi:MAG TPA: cytochrome c oxidase subunit II [Candidatus Acidoferrum sp.]
MQSQMPLYPEQASNFAPQVDNLVFFMISVCLFFAVAICVAVIYFFFKYQRKQPDEIGVPIHGDLRLEITWIVLPFFLLLAMFGWGAAVYVDFRHTPADTLDIYVIGKQWMWRLQQPDGHREINELHVPVNRNVRLIMGSEDVIHDFSVPSFRVKMDVVPGHYNTMWFRPTRVGKYHFFCSQYCGTNHAVMGGWITVMEPDEYAKWLAGTSGSGDPVAMGEKLINDLACNTCHLPDGKGRGPSYNGVYGSAVKLADGSTVVADDAYIRESILQPNAKIVAGYVPVMPSFQGLVTEDQILQLTAYIKSVKDQPPPKKSGAAEPEAGKK